jgi:ABC-type multidrug transport system ATPase subunit
VTAAPWAEARPTFPRRPLTPAAAREPVLSADGIVREFAGTLALDGVSLELGAGEIRALVGPNGAGKTTLLRILCGLLEPHGGSLRMLGAEITQSRELRREIGLVPSGTRSFYLRISGFENLAFFGRLHGLRRREAASRALDALEAVDLAEAAHRSVATYSTGMQRRLAVARALLHRPSILLIDEATHDLDPEQAVRVRALVAEAAAQGAAVLWTTQRLEELHGFGDTVTLIDRGHCRFDGTLHQLLEVAGRRRYLLGLETGDGEGVLNLPLQLGRLGSLDAVEASSNGRYLLTLADGAILGDALESLCALGMRVVSCSEAQASIEEAFLSLLAARQ